MKKLMMSIMIISMLVCLTYAEDDFEMATLINGKISHGGYGGPVVKMGYINGDMGVLVGGHGGWIINHRLVLGGGGYGLSNDIPMITDDDEQRYLNFGYGGFEMGYVIASNRLLHFDFNTLIGAGGVGTRYSIYDEDDYDWDYDDDYDTEPIFVLEPSLTLMLNVTRNIRVGAGLSYRYVSGIETLSVTDSDLCGTSATLMIKFGAF